MERTASIRLIMTLRSVGENFRQELPGTLRPRRGEELLGRGFLHHPAGVHEDDAVGHPPRESHLVRDDDHRHAVLREVGHDVKDFVDHLRIERRGGLVEEHDLRLHRQRTLERVHAADEGALARARRAAHDDHLARRHGQRDVAQDVHLPEPFVDGPELDHRVGHQLITTRTSPAFTAWPGLTRTSATVPGAPARSSFSIFIASITRSVSPATTVSPVLTATWVILPGSGAVRVWGPAPAAAPPLVRMT